jgi:hypothetical protein
MNYNILELVFEYISVNKLIKLEVVCKLWLNIINDNRLYYLQKRSKYLIRNIKVTNWICVNINHPNCKNECNYQNVPKNIHNQSLYTYFSAFPCGKHSWDAPAT